MFLNVLLHISQRSFPGASVLASSTVCLGLLVVPGALWDLGAGSFTCLVRDVATVNNGAVLDKK